MVEDGGCFLDEVAWWLRRWWWRLRGRGRTGEGAGLSAEGGKALGSSSGEGRQVRLEEAPTAEWWRWGLW